MPGAACLRRWPAALPVRAETDLYFLNNSSCDFIPGSDGLSCNIFHGFVIGSTIAINPTPFSSVAIFSVRAPPCSRFLFAIVVSHFPIDFPDLSALASSASPTRPPPLRPSPPSPPPCTLTFNLFDFRIPTFGKLTSLLTHTHTHRDTHRSGRYRKRKRRLLQLEIPTSPPHLGVSCGSTHHFLLEPESTHFPTGPHYAVK